MKNSWLFLGETYMGDWRFVISEMGGERFRLDGLVGVGWVGNFDKRGGHELKKKLAPAWGRN